ncbi:MAG TPA: tRNA-dihydrouridine synthase [Gemmatales bacterium]|nr:tRNA-dihydrouridine synthase [Gemmatales bacterium]
MSMPLSGHGIPHTTRKPGQLLTLGGKPLASRYALAPLAGYTNVAFRMAVRSCGGVGWVTSDLVNARALLQGTHQTMELLATVKEDRPLAVQLYGHEAGYLRAAAQWLEGYGVTAVDINMGCPVHKVTRGGGGSAMMCNPEATVALVDHVVKGVRIPVTVKMRLGWNSETLSAPYFAQAFEGVGVAAITIHGRTRAQGFRGNVDRSGIRQVVQAVKHIPILGNGDVRTIADAQAMFDETGCAAIAIGRGALLNPWLFAQLHHWDITGEKLPIASNGEHIAFMVKHFESLVKLRGEWYGCLSFRKMSGWYGKAIPMGKQRQIQLGMVASVAEFHQLVAEIRQELGSQLNQPSKLAGEIKVPSGPNERW